jgi:hypothetical protein
LDYVSFAQVIFPPLLISFPISSFLLKPIWGENNWQCDFRCQTVALGSTEQVGGSETEKSAVAIRFIANVSETPDIYSQANNLNGRFDSPKNGQNTSFHIKENFNTKTIGGNGTTHH